MWVLGISALDKESTVALFNDSELIYAASEERITRVKQQDGFPYQSIYEAFEYGNISAEDLDGVTFPFLPGKQEEAMRRAAIQKNIADTFAFSKFPISGRLLHLANAQRAAFLSDLAKYDNMLVDGLERLGLLDKLYRYNHQQTHAYSTYFYSNFDEALILSLDGYGSGLAGGFYQGKKGKIKTITEIPYPHSMGGFYGSITKRLGFKLHRHEGKVLGLAAYGDPSILYDRVRRRFTDANDGTFRFIDANNIFFDMYVAKFYKQHDVAAAYQAVLEDVVVNMTKRFLRKTSMTKLAVAGGVMANVKLNQRLASLEEVDEIFVYPGMSDIGTSVGGALMHLSKFNQPTTSKPMHTIYLSKDETEAQHLESINTPQLEYSWHPNGAEKEIARLLAEKKVVGRVNGKMEFGPRSLGNRSILYSAEDPKVNDWLNAQLGRTEFMPFAPACLYEDADDFFIGLSKCRKSSEFMTITCDCTEKMKRQNPAAVHVDGTARPQLVTSQANPSFHKVLLEYKKLTGNSVLINTSFNMHEEPIVYSANDAVRAYLASKIDYLALGNYIVWRRSQSPASKLKQV